MPLPRLGRVTGFATMLVSAGKQKSRMRTRVARTAGSADAVGPLARPDGLRLVLAEPAAPLGALNRLRFERDRVSLRPQVRHRGQHRRRLISLAEYPAGQANIPVLAAHGEGLSERAADKAWPLPKVWQAAQVLAIPDWA
jgi:hypothetical protein